MSSRREPVHLFIQDCCLRHAPRIWCAGIRRFAHIDGLFADHERVVLHLPVNAPEILSHDAEEKGIQANGEQNEDGGGRKAGRP